MAYLFTADGERVDRMRKMASGHDVDEVMKSLLGSRPNLSLPRAPAFSQGIDPALDVM